MFIKLTHTFNDEYFYINVEYIETIHSDICGSQIITINTEFNDSVGYTVKENPEQIIEMIECIKK